jgi:hypothetical protein
MTTMATDTITQPADLSGLSLTQIAALPTLDEILERVVDRKPSVPAASFNSAI